MQFLLLFVVFPYSNEFPFFLLSFSFNLGIFFSTKFVNFNILVFMQLLLLGSVVLLHLLIGGQLHPMLRILLIKSMLNVPKLLHQLLLPVQDNLLVGPQLV